MEFQHTAMELIRKRKSVRTFDGRRLKKEDKEALLEYLAKLNREIRLDVRFAYVETGQEAGKKKLGTYGFISGVIQYLVVVLNREETDAVELGCVFEKVILHALDLGIQTCWLGGTFRREEFAKAAGCSDQEYIPLVSPLGYEKSGKRFFETSMRKAVGADKRKPWEELFYDMDRNAPLDKKILGDYAQVLEMVRLGPSASNRQPWRIAKEGSRFHFFLKRTKGYVIGGYDTQQNDLGIAKCHFDLTAAELGLKGRWEKADPLPYWDGLEYIVTWVMEE